MAKYVCGYTSCMLPVPPLKQQRKHFRPAGFENRQGPSPLDLAVIAGEASPPCGSGPCAQGIKPLVLKVSRGPLFFCGPGSRAIDDSHRLGHCRGKPCASRRWKRPCSQFWPVIRPLDAVAPTCPAEASTRLISLLQSATSSFQLPTLEQETWTSLVV